MRTTIRRRFWPLLCACLGAGCGGGQDASGPATGASSDRPAEVIQSPAPPTTKTGTGPSPVAPVKAF
jgi:hypothetical protein